MFDKVIISVDELSLPRKKEKLQDRGFSFVPAKYGKNVDVIKQIIRKLNYIMKVLIVILMEIF